MDNEIKAVEHTVRIIFDPKRLKEDPFTFQVDAGPVEEDFSIEVHANVAVILFYLQTLTEDLQHEASLATSPIQWLTPAGSAAPMPASFFLRRDGDSQMTLIDLNGVDIPHDKVTFNFEIAVVYKGRTYTSPDPTIVNVQPPPPEDGGVKTKPRPAELMVS